MPWTFAPHDMSRINRSVMSTGVAEVRVGQRQRAAEAVQQLLRSDHGRGRERNNGA